MRRHWEVGRLNTVAAIRRKIDAGVVGTAVVIAQIGDGWLSEYVQRMSRLRWLTSVHPARDIERATRQAESRKVKVVRGARSPARTRAHPRGDVEFVPAAEKVDWVIRAHAVSLGPGQQEVRDSIGIADVHLRHHEPAGELVE